MAGRCAFGEPLGREQSGRDRGVDVHDGDRSAGLEHRTEGGFAATAPAVPDGGGYADHRSPHKTRDDGRERSFAPGEDEVDLRAPGLETLQRTEQPMDPGDPHIVRPHGADPKLRKNRTRLFGKHHVARAGRNESDRAGPVLGTQRPRETEKPAVRESTYTQPSRTRRRERTQLGRGGVGHERALPAVGQPPEDPKKLLDGLPLPEDHLGDPDASGPVPIESRVLPNDELARP